jgi:phosphate starvation-inducible protein PhoH
MPVNNNNKKRTVTDLSQKPSTSFSYPGSEQIIDKAFDPQNRLNEIIKTNFDIDIKIEKRRLRVKKSEPVTTVPMLVLSGGTTENRKKAKASLTKVFETIEQQQKEALKFVLKSPKKFSKKLDLILEEDDLNLLKETLTEKVDSLRPTVQNHNEKNNAGETAIKTVKDAVNRVKNAVVNSNLQSASVIKELLEGATKDFPAPTDLTKYYAEKISNIGKELDRRIITLEERISAHDKLQVNAHISSKHKFKATEREEIKTTISRSLETQSMTMESAEIDILLSSVLFEMDNIVFDKTSIEKIVKDTVTPPALEVVKPRISIRQPAKPKEVNPFMAYSLVDGKYVPQTNSQAEQVAIMRANGTSIIIGDAGTGKSLAMIAYAVDRLKSEHKKIMILRPMVELGNQQTIGYLPGGELEKIGPGFRPILKNLLKVSSRAEAKKWLGLDDKKSPAKNSNILDMLMPTHDIQITPMAYLRGDTIDDMTILVEEAQNLTLMEANAIGTRVGKNTQVIFSGDKIQTDLPMKDRHGKWLPEEKMPALPIMIAAKGFLKKMGFKGEVGIVIHPKENVVRSETAKNNVEFFQLIRENSAEIYQLAFNGYGKESPQVNYAAQKSAANTNALKS